jgi:hypothetical protein
LANKNLLDMTKQERFDRLCERLLDDSARSHMQCSGGAKVSADSVMKRFADLCHEVNLSLTTADNLFYARFGLPAESFLLLF